jgi:type VI secretion system protein ImpG
MTRVSLRYLDQRGDPVFIRLDPKSIEQVGFDDDDHLFTHNTRVFRGFSRLREIFVFPRKILGFRLRGLAQHLKRIQAHEFQIVMEFNKADKVLAPRVDANHFSLHSVPAVNLF